MQPNDECSSCRLASNLSVFYGKTISLGHDSQPFKFFLYLPRLRALTSTMILIHMSIVWVVQNSFLRCSYRRGDDQERMRRCFGLFLSTVFMTPPHQCEVSLPVQLYAVLLSAISTHSSWCPLSSTISSDLLSQQSPEELLLWYFFSLDQVLPLTHFVTLVAMNPLQPTSTGKCIAFHHASSHSSTGAS